MTFLKNILFVSYLKNKGIRRICFILGILFAIFPSASWYDRLNRHFYDLSFNNIDEVQMSYEYKYNDEILKNIFYKYPMDFGKKLKKFEHWEDFFFNSYTEAYKDRKQLIKICNDLLRQSNNAEKLKLDGGYWSQFEEVKPKNFDKKQMEFCQKFDKYINQPIHISSYDFAYILELWGVIVAFYFPFLFCCLIRWIYMGFKEK